MPIKASNVKISLLQLHVCINSAQWTTQSIMPLILLINHKRKKHMVREYDTHNKTGTIALWAVT